MIGYVRRALPARLRESAALHVLTVVGVALGVAAVLAIRILNASAVESFAGGVEAISGSADVTVEGVATPLPDSLFSTVLGTPGVAGAWPRVEVDVALAEDTGEPAFFQVVGVDLLAPRRIPWSGDSFPVGEALATPGWAAVSPQAAGRFGWARGDTVEVLHGTRRVDLVVGARVDFRRVDPFAPTRLVLMDVARAQALFGDSGRVDAIDVVAAESVDVPTLVERLTERLGPGARVDTPRERATATASLLSAFRLNLTALSLVSLIVGVFLVYSAVRAALARRRAELGLLRASGATRSQVVSLVAGEAVALAIGGAAIGLPVGWLAARYRLDAVSGTLTDLFMTQGIERLEVPATAFVLALVAGIAGAVAGAVPPAIEMARRPPGTLLTRATLEERTGELAGRLAIGGLGVLALAVAWYGLLGRDWRPAGFVLALALLVALPLVTPWAVKATAGRVRPRGFGPGFALASLAERLQTTSVAVAALAVAVGLMVGLTIMVGSFRSALEQWVDTAVAADVYVSPVTWRRDGSGGALGEEVLATLREEPGVRAVDPLRIVVAGSGDDRVRILGVEMGLVGGRDRFPVVEGDEARAYREAATEGGVLVGEPLARRRGLAPGDSIRIVTPEGRRAFPVAGVYAEYDAHGGTVAMDLATMASAFGPGPPTSAALYLRPGVDGARVVDRLKAGLEGLPLTFRSSESIGREALSTFDQTFAITRLLRSTALAVAACGVALTLLVLAREQRAELALYRALGAGRGRLVAFYLGKGLGIGVLALGLGGLVGLGLAAILVEVVNPAFFGWTIRARWADPALVGQAALVLVAAVGAAIFPALAARKAPAEVLGREPA
ncbi:MAG: FtsX-like permease family protein [Gemmatimonadota bacterium]|nr:FtsX-like permease family protein [Gemmatimonadota bacterium]